MREEWKELVTGSADMIICGIAKVPVVMLLGALEFGDTAFATVMADLVNGCRWNRSVRTVVFPAMISKSRIHILFGIVNYVISRILMDRLLTRTKRSN